MFIELLFQVESIVLTEENYIMRKESTNCSELYEVAASVGSHTPARSAVVGETTQNFVAKAV